MKHPNYISWYHGKREILIDKRVSRVTIPEHRLTLINECLMTLNPGEGLVKETVTKEGRVCQVACYIKPGGKKLYLEKFPLLEDE